LETLDDIPLAFNQIPEVGTLFNKDASNEDILALKKTFITNEISTNFEETFKSTDSIFRENLFNSIQANFEIGEISTINALPCPFTLYYSKNEKILNDDYRVKLTTRIKKASFTGLEIEGHFPMLEDSIKFNKALEDNLTELDS
jgi:pimeloyl-ACP methyl ester carboxylesterase